MTVTVVEVDAGCCGFTTTIEILKVDSRMVKAAISSDCEMITAWGKALGPLDWRQCIRGFVDSPVFQYCSKHIGHVACPVPVALLKAIEVEAGLALPANVTIRFDDASTK
jgi:hypothetical protein